MDIEHILAELSHERPIFHSEKDFQFALAWAIQTRYPKARVRLEYRLAGPAKIYIDLWVALSKDRIFAVELKYRTRNLEVEFGNESFRLLNQSAHDQGRYDFLRDVVRLEQLTAGNARIRGAAILLTNDAQFWSPSRSAETVDAAFHICQGRELQGELAWGAKAAPGTKRNREDPIKLATACNIAWSDYSQVGDLGSARFRYTLINVVAGNLPQ